MGDLSKGSGASRLDVRGKAPPPLKLAVYWTFTAYALLAGLPFGS